MKYISYEITDISDSLLLVTIYLKGMKIFELKNTTYRFLNNLVEILEFVYMNGYNTGVETTVEDVKNSGVLKDFWTIKAGEKE